MKSYLRFSFFCCLSSFILFSCPVSAVLVFDPSNFSKNTLISMQQLEGIRQRSLQIVNQIKNYKLLMRQAMSIHPSKLIGIQALDALNIDALRDFSQRFSSIYQALDLLEESHISPLSLNQKNNQLQQLERLLEDQVDYDKAVLNQLEHEQEALAQIKISILDSGGVQESVQILNTQIARLIEQNAVLLSYFAMESSVKKINKKNKVSKKRKSNSAKRRARRRQKENKEITLGAVSEFDKLKDISLRFRVK